MKYLVLLPLLLPLSGLFTAACGSSHPNPLGNGGGASTQSAGTALGSGTASGGVTSTTGGGGSGGGDTSTTGGGCKPGNSACQGFIECCSGVCSNQVCTTCSSQGQACGAAKDCCTDLVCYEGQCGKCADDGASCALAGECRSGTCNQGTCSASVKTDCDGYCAGVMANCTLEYAQYVNKASCLATCATFPLGKIGDTDGNSLGCRLYHGGAPAQAAPSTHCAHAGPTGGDMNVTDTSAGTCGEGCAAFCGVALDICVGANQQYPSKQACMTECKTFKPDMTTYTTSDTNNDDFGCRMYHLTVAAIDAPSAVTHCPHIRAASPVCTQ